MKSLKFIVLLAVILGFLHNVGADSLDFDKKFNQIQIKMDTTGVQKILGPPDLREANESSETWHYGKGENGRKIVFKGGVVSEFGKESSNVAPSATPEPINLQIGDRCSDDDQCKSKNCHFHKCAGKNNCTVPEGKVCATNNDCCTDFCSMGICRKK